LVSKKFARVNILRYGSGKTGATNVLRTAGKKAAILALALDILKGALAVSIAGLIIGKSYLMIGNFGFGAILAQVLAALAAVVGHNWSVFLKFRGGSGVATFFGGWIALLPMVGLIGGEILILGAGLTRFVSLGSIAGVVGTYAILVPLTVLNGLPLEYLIYASIGVLFIIIRHRGNIVRLLSGKERKLGEKTEPVQVPPSEESGG
jgi:glycerol-3-phosphate acyltransferase PlsY